ncbi:SET domain-containing protein [Phytophthora infestans]|uniref:SET domain-containing protein n=1 Tax=Phytophthora infestans TaxID=4787 RepID=A0A833SGP7_PHYIN|nr:SET domain-containing protein [Phytophthora infestans]
MSSKRRSANSSILAQPSPDRPAKKLKTVVSSYCKLRLHAPTTVGASSGDSTNSSMTKSKSLSLLKPSDGVATLPWMRSGRAFTHPLVNEGETMQTAPLADFHLSQSSETDSLSPRKTQLEHGAQMKAGRSTPPTSPASTLASMGSPLLTSSQETADAPWSPRTCTPRPVPVSSRPDVPKWFSECFESDGYNTDELILIGPPPPSQRRRTSILSQSSSPGFSVIVQSAGVALNSEWLDVDWPPEVTRLNVQSNPLGLKFPTLSTGIRGDQGCGCEVRCTASTCLNAKRSRFCTARNCSFVGVCGNAPQEKDSLAIRQNTRTRMRGVVATAPIPAGEVVGEYFGVLELFGPPSKPRQATNGYRMFLKTRTKSNKYVGIDSLHAGGLMRLVNHSCNPCAGFHEVQTGDHLTVVVVTVLDVFSGEELTVSYGSKLWLLCRCGWWGCQHRDLQHLPDGPDILQT